MPEADVVQTLRDTRADVLVSYLPVGSEEADRFYAQCAIDAGVGFVNALPVFTRATPSGRGSSPTPACPSSETTSRARWARRSRTGCSRSSSRTAASSLDRTYQLNFGGNMDFKNMLERERLVSKKISKTQSVQSQPRSRSTDDIHIGLSDHVPWLEDRKGR